MTRRVGGGAWGLLFGVTGVTLGTVYLVHKGQKDDARRMRQAVYKDIERQKRRKKKAATDCDICDLKPEK